MSEARRDVLRVGFDRTVRLKVHGSRATTGAGLIAYREISREDQVTAMVSRQEVTDD